MDADSPHRSPRSKPIPRGARFISSSIPLRNECTLCLRNRRRPSLFLLASAKALSVSERSSSSRAEGHAVLSLERRSIKASESISILHPARFTSRQEKPSQLKRPPPRIRSISRLSSAFTGTAENWTLEARRDIKVPRELSSFLFPFLRRAFFFLFFCHSWNR